MDLCKLTKSIMIIITSTVTKFAITKKAKYLYKSAACVFALLPYL